MTFGSTHGALRAEKIARQAGFVVWVVPQPREIRGACGTALLTADDSAAAVQGALKAAGHPPRQMAQVLSAQPPGHRH